MKPIVYRKILVLTSQDKGYLTRDDISIIFKVDKQDSIIKFDTFIGIMFKKIKTPTFLGKKIPFGLTSEIIIEEPKFKYIVSKTKKNVFLKEK